MAADAAGSRAHGAGSTEPGSSFAKAAEDSAGSTEQEEGTIAAFDNSIPVGPTPEEEAALLTPDRTSEQFYGQLPPKESADAEPVAGTLPPMEDLVKRIPAPTRELLEELFRARFVTVKRVPKAALKN